MKYADLFNLVPVGYFVLDDKGIIQEVNNAGAKMLGQKKTALVSEAFSRFITPNYQGNFDLYCQQVFQTSTKQSCELKLVKDNGAFVYVQMTSIALADSPKKLIHQIAITDVTKHKKIDTQLQSALVESQKARKEIAALLEGARSVMQSASFEETARAIFDSAKTLIGAKAGYIALTKPDGKENDVVFLDAGELPCTVEPDLPMPIRGLREVAYQGGEVVFDNDFANSEWMQFMPPGHAELENVLFAPMQIEGQVVGLLGLANKRENFTENDASLAAAFAGLVAVALYSSRNLESLVESEEKFRSLVQTATDAILTIDHLGKIVYWNDASEKIFGYSTAEIIGQPCTLIMPKRYRKAHKDGLNRTVSSGKERIIGKTVEMDGLRKNGHEFCLELSLTKWKSKNQTFITAIIRDITERKLLMEVEAVRQSEARLAEAQRLAHLGNWEWKIKKNELFWSEEIYRIFGLSSNEFDATFEAFLAFVHPDDRDFVKKSVDDALHKKKQYNIDHRIIRPDGEERIVHEQGKVTFAKSCQPTRMIGTVQDITERKRVEEALKASQTKLQEQKLALEQKNIALKEILEQIGLEKKKIQDDVIANVDKLLVPTLKKLKMQPRPIDRQYIDIIQENLEELTSSFGSKISEKKINLTPKEMEVCNLIKSGLANKEISELLSITLRTVESHRKSIRKKLGIANQDINLTVYLQTL